MMQPTAGGAVAVAAATDGASLGGGPLLVALRDSSDGPSESTVQQLLAVGCSAAEIQGIAQAASNLMAKQYDENLVRNHGPTHRLLKFAEC